MTPGCDGMRADADHPLIGERRPPSGEWRGVIRCRSSFCKFTGYQPIQPILSANGYNSSVNGAASSPETG